MAWSAVCKLLQRRSIDLISQKTGCRLLAVGIFVILVMSFQLGEVLVTWSAEKYAAVFSPFSDNIGGRSFQERLCLPVPIDVVYTWVNGSDPSLLKELNEFRRQLKHDLNQSMAADRCNFVHCVPAFGMTVDPPFPQDITLRHFGILYPVFKEATDMFTVEDVVRNVNLTAVMFESADVVKTALKQNVVIAGRTAVLQQLYYSSDGSLHNSKAAENTLIMSGLPYSEAESRLTNKVTEKYESKNIISFTLHSEKGVAVIKVSNQEVFKTILADKNMTVNGKSIAFSAARYVWDLRDYSHNEDISASRFEDNEELRYSLRSVEKYAPWVRHIFVVTNGQMPSWLNMDNPRLTVVTHQELFVNKSHLPTFSSPAIESHIHRIKGLSDKFIYLNDDVMFGKEVWPDDFYTEAGGQKIYLTWPVPNCQEGCPASWIKDGYCDRSCNNSECEWDGGDCVGSTALQPLYGGGGQGHGALWSALGTYCNSGCANNWIADKYCDVACNVQQCAFDAGDCGVDRFNLLYRVDLRADKIHYSAVGHNPVYFNYSSLVTDLESVDEGFYEEDAIIRSMSIAQKFQVVTLVLNANSSATVFNFSLHVKDSNLQPLILNFTVLLDTTFEEKLVAVIKNETKTIIHSSKSPAKNDSFELPFAFTPKDGRLNPFPKDRNVSFPKDNFPFNWSAISLPIDVHKKFEMIEKQYSDGDLTETGYHRQIIELLETYINESWSVEIQLQKFGVSTVKSSAVAKPIKRNDMFVQHLDILKKKLGNKNKSETHDKNEKLHSKRPMKMVGNKQMTENEVVLEKSSESKHNKATGRLSRTLLFARDDDDDDDDIEGNKNEIYRHLELSSKAVESYGFLPWEKLGIFNDFQQAFDNRRKQEDYFTSSRNKRRLLDTFANSLRHVSRIYNKAYGYTSRKVPAHIAHMIDRNIMTEMQAKFPDDWAETSSHRMRSSDDMQYAFAYFYYLMSETRILTINEMFNELDSDHSGTLSDREIRTMATRLYSLPLELENLVELEEHFINCSKNESSVSTSISAEEVRNERFRKEVYYDKRMPQVTLGLITGCNPIQNLLKIYMKSRPKYRFDIVGDDEVVFKMIRHNVSLVVAHLDEIRKTPKKFVCINDNIDYGQESAKLVKAVLRDFYESILPVPSKFELSKEYRNKFLHIDELRRWWRYRELVRWILYTFLFILMLFALSTFICDTRGLSWARRRLFHR